MLILPPAGELLKLKCCSFAQYQTLLDASFSKQFPLDNYNQHTHVSSVGPPLHRHLCIQTSVLYTHRNFILNSKNYYKVSKYFKYLYKRKMCLKKQKITTLIKLLCQESWRSSWLQCLALLFPFMNLFCDSCVTWLLSHVINIKLSMKNDTYSL